MHYWLILASILFGLANAQRIAYLAPLFGTCSYTGDPHLTPFPTSVGGISNVYFCSTIGWQVLLQNQWVLIAVQVGPSPYVIVNYVVLFFKADSSLACVLIGGLGLSTCSASSGISSVINPGGTSWNHLYPLAQYLNIQIVSYPWGSTGRYDFFIRETFSLIGVSKGLCVKYDCPLERIIFPPPPIITRLCEVYVAAAQKQAVGLVNEARVKFVTLSCQNDVTLTFDAQLAQTAVNHIIISSLDGIAGESYQAAAEKADANIQAALRQAASDTARIFQQGDTCANQTRCLTAGN